MTTLHELGEDIRKRVQELAYMMWESAGRQHGMALEYWVAAEREVMATARQATERMLTPQPAGTEAAPAAKAAPKASEPKAAAAAKLDVAVKPEAAAVPADTAKAPPPKPARRTGAGRSASKS
ncbi:MAG: DUF2934 domain-containing protein [Rhodospirillales bacterium]|jgi:hypothetical protein|nr:DUF2934 domain-containing protein [Rhodospirillales bacterium]